MASFVRPRLTIPTVLTVSALGLSLGCPAGDDGETGNEGTQTGPGTTQGMTEGPGTTQGTEAATAGQTSDATTSGTTAATGLDTGSTFSTGSTTATGTTGEPEPLPDCAIYMDEPACMTEPLCHWYPKFGGCIVYCEMIDDEATCESTGLCDWFDGYCYSPK